MSSPPSEALSPVSSPPESPLDPTEANSTVARDFASLNSPSSPVKVPTLRPTSGDASVRPPAPGMTPSSTPLGNLSAARHPLTGSPKASALPSSMLEKMKAFHLSRQGPAAGGSGLSSPISQTPTQLTSPLVAAAPGGGPVPMGGALAGTPGGLRLPASVRPSVINANSAPAVPGIKPKIGGGLAAKRGLKGGMKLSDVTGETTSPGGTTGDGGSGGATTNTSPRATDSAFVKYADLLDTAAGTLNFKGKAVLSGSGVQFEGGSSISISLDEVDTIAELGKGNYGTVYQVRHNRPRIRVPGVGLAGNKAPLAVQRSVSESASTSHLPDAQNSKTKNTTGVIMAMKELRLELDDAKFASIAMELDILHKCTSPFVVDFYGAFFQEGAVYICMEFMDGGSIDKLYAGGVPEPILKKIALSTVMGLKTLKDDHSIIHRDVKPTNILMNTRGQIKICDFGVSGNLVASMARTNIGCQSYMAPERIRGGGMTQLATGPTADEDSKYGVQSDIWSLGLTLIECAMGRYPYPPETYNNIFSQLSAIVEGDPPDLPQEGYSDQARAFVRSCLHKVPKLRPTYDMLIRHAWLASLIKPPTLSEDADAERAAEEGAEMYGTAAAAAGHGIGAGAAAAVSGASVPDTADPEVAAWVMEALERRRQGKLQGATKPALHTARLDELPTPDRETPQAAEGDDS